MPANPLAFQRLRVGLEVFAVRDSDLDGVVLRRIGQTHRAQMRRVFQQQKQGELYPWKRLSPAYQAWKTRLLGRPGKILQLSGETLDRFTKKSRSEYVERYIRPSFFLGASSDIAGYHARGTATLPKRDMVTKSVKQMRELRQTLLIWYRTERIPQAQRALRQLGGA